MLSKILCSGKAAFLVQLDPSENILKMDCLQKPVALHAGLVTSGAFELWLFLPCNSKLHDLFSLQLVTNSINQVVVETPKKLSHGSCCKN